VKRRWKDLVLRKHGTAVHPGSKEWMHIMTSIYNDEPCPRGYVLDGKDPGDIIDWKGFVDSNGNVNEI